ncbi:DNA-directed RNA polymerase III, subunit Rpc31 [Lasiosphaeria hispida]|uniref:DNA-directed RNA polymerase III subunit n=1 Tax=Lasiosphaeria hispida TaxID=260671 RepID=A0AAJ0MDY3_9PEZI|nr:DNA-directed RNA polymerase III, subunit Rpc31 [Lasiosphaeria hispida]
MSRGGGGGRGGRGRGGATFGNGKRAVASNSVPWNADPDLVVDGKPSELFPPYDVPQAPHLSKKEDKQVSFFLLFREQCHDGPLYTQARSWTQDFSKPRRTYGQDQINKRYGQTSKATVDPFLAVPTYAQKFTQSERTLPDLESRPFAKEFFPPELHATLDGDDGGGPASKRRKTGPKTLGLSNITQLKTAEELFLPEGMENGSGNLDKAMEVLATMEKREDGEEDGFLSGEEDDWVKENGEEGEDNAEDEDQYDDDSGDDDYNAEAYFEGNQDEDDYDEGGGGDDGGADYM